MGESFDPYHEWLGIPPKDQPPNYYRLLGIDPLESKQSVIANAAERQIFYVKRKQAGSQPEEAGQILQELLKARACLVDSRQKEQYDRQLREKLSAEQPLASPSSLAVAGVTPALPPKRPASKPPARPGKAAAQADVPGAQSARPIPWRLIAMFGGLGATVAALILVLAVLLYSSNSQTAQKNPSDLKKSDTAAGDEYEYNFADDDPEDEEPEKKEPAEKVEKENPTPPQQPKVEETPSVVSTALVEMEGPVVDLMAAIDPTRAVLGNWEKSDGQLTVEPDLSKFDKERLCLLASPVKPPSSYELTLSVKRLAGKNSLGLALALGDGRQTMLLLDRDEKFSGLEKVDDRELIRSPALRNGASLLPKGETKTVVCTVDRDHIVAKIDDETIVDWRGDFDRLSMPDSPLLANKSALYLFVERSSFEFSEIKLAKVDAATSDPGTTPDDGAKVPEPIARWTFERDFLDDIGGLHGSGYGGAKIRDGRLHLGGDGYVLTSTLESDLKEKTLEVWTSLDTLDQRNVGVMSISQGRVQREIIYDALVFGDRDALTWRSGSNSSKRTQRFGGPTETADPGELIHMALVYHADGTVAAYRNGKPYGTIIQTTPVTFGEASAQVAFGRLSSADTGRMLGTIDQAQLFNRALTAVEIAALASTPPISKKKLNRVLAELPSEELRKAAGDRIRGLYKSEFSSATTPALKRRLAQRLVAMASKTVGDESSRYMLFQAARDTYAQAGDIEGAISAVDIAAKNFKLDALQLKQEALSVAAKNAVGLQYATVARSADALIVEAVERDDFESARKMIKITQFAARKSQVTEVTRQSFAREKQIELLEKNFTAVQAARESLKENPDDAEANLLVGKYRAFINHQWEEGLPLLARGSDEKLKTLAQLETGDDQTAAIRLELAEGWWEVSEAFEEVYKPALRHRAAHWYRLALPDLEGLDKEEAEKRLLEIEIQDNDGWRVVFRASNPAYWNSNIDLEKAYAISLDKLADDIKFLRIKRMDTGQLLIVPMNKGILVEGGAISSRLLWNASTGRKSRVVNLGIASSALKVETGHPWIGSSGKSGYGGWGFGGLWGDPDSRIVTWQGALLQDVNIEIAVKSDSLSREEIRWLPR